MSSTRAKFKCQAIITHQVSPTGLGFTIWLEPVTSGSFENDSFFEATPGGRIELQIVNEAAAALFQVEKEYYVDFTMAEI